ncbi:Uncharacterised protein [Salmonella enterica subsp. enterica serovar Typhimurium str. DT104]|nr:Uncharacterised protein [Salmonella enterica subsp. enterica serovar Typhimurium str. DT104]CQF02787.1 Uncharacterised protein [Salmonella enterica subsp. enterica serovar Typhimurium str. DT104]
MRIAGSHIAFGFDNASRQKPFLFIGKHAVAAILDGLTAPPRTDVVQNTFVFFTYGKTCAGPVRQVVDLFFNPRDGIFRENRRGADFTCLVADDQFIVFYPDSAFRQVMGQRQRTAYRNRFIQMLLVHFGIMLRALGTDRRFHDMYQRGFVRLNAVTERVQFQLGHDNYPRRVAVKPFWQAYFWAKSSNAGASSGLSGA